MPAHITLEEPHYFDDSTGRAYQCQIKELVRSSRQFLADLRVAQHDALLQKALLAAEMALRCAAEAGEQLTNQASKAFGNAEEMLHLYERTVYRSLFTPEVPLRMFRARQDDLRLLDTYAEPDSRWKDIPDASILVKFILLRFSTTAAPLLVHQFLSIFPTISMIVWNFAQYTDNRRIALSQNPHFYLCLPRSGAASAPFFGVRDFIPISGNDTVYVTVDKPSQSRVFLHTGHGGCSFFGNAWIPGDTLIFKDISGRLRRERVLRCDTFEDRGNHHWDSQLVPLYSESSAPSRNQSRQPFSVNIHISGTKIEKETLSSTLDCSVCFGVEPPQYNANARAWASCPPPTSERPRHRVLYTYYTAIDMLNDDTLLVVFNHYRLDDEIDWNGRLEWCRLSHVCQRWRRLIFESAFHLDMHILCTNGTPLVDTLAHLPPLPLVVDYQYSTATISTTDKLGILLALQLRDRLRRVVLRIPPSVLDELLVLMDKPSPVLEHLSLSSSTEERTILSLPKTLLAQNLRHLTLLGIGLPKKLLLLSSTVSLITLTLTNIREYGYFIPQHLVARLRSFHQLEELSIGFAIPLPRPGNESELWEEMEAVATLPLLKRLAFRGVSAYLESFISQIRAPLLDRLDITLFNQIHFALPHLSHFTSTTAGLMLPLAKIIFKHDAVSIAMGHHRQGPGDGLSSFVLDVTCRQFDWQVDCAAQICTSLSPTLFCVEQLSLDFEGQEVPAVFEDDAVDDATWRELLVPFIGAKRLRICHALAWELSCALIDPDPALLPSLDELATELDEGHVRDNAFVAFIEARQALGRPVMQLALPAVSRDLEESRSLLSLITLEAPVSPTPPPPKKGSWIRRSIIQPIRKHLA